MPHRVNFNEEPQQAISVAAAAIARGGIVIFPTETFYGLAVDPNNAQALRRLADIKDRSASKPVPVIAANREACARLGPVPEVLAPLCQMFWPGPLTVALTPSGNWSPILVGHGKTIGVRVSSHPAAQALAAAAGGLITSTSANLAGKPPSSNVFELDPALTSLVDVVMDGGVLTGGLASTVLFARGEDVVILRAGAISDQDIKQVLGRLPVTI